MQTTVNRRNRVRKSILAQIFRINASQDIVGGYVDSVGCGIANCSHGFVHRLANSNRL